MKTIHQPRRGFTRPTALLTASVIALPTLVAGCSGGNNAVAPGSPPPGIGSTASRPQQGMSGKQKMMLLAGAAALYYIYNKRKNAASQGQVQYYRSETSGRIYYYKNPKDRNSVTFVSPPTRPIEVPMNEAQQYQQYQGYNNQTSGQQYGGYGYNPNGQYNTNGNAVPAEMF